jgi:hypothetical protein
MSGYKAQKVDAARSAASTFWVLVCFNTSGDICTDNFIGDRFKSTLKAKVGLII